MLFLHELNPALLLISYFFSVLLFLRMTMKIVRTIVRMTASQMKQQIPRKAGQIGGVLYTCLRLLCSFWNLHLLLYQLSVHGYLLDINPDIDILIL